MLLASFNTMAAYPQYGKDFDKTLHDIPTNLPDKIVVTEIFSYANTMSYHMYPVIDAWVKKLPTDVVFKRVPYAMGNYHTLAEFYFVMDEMNLVEKLHGPFFEALQNPHTATISPLANSGTFEWLAKRTGLNGSQLMRESQTGLRLGKYHLAWDFFNNAGASPAIVIDGQFIVALTGNNEHDLKVADYIIKHIRSDKAGAKNTK